jgi:hypothetical protein
MADYERLLHNSADEDPLNVRVNASLNGSLDELPDTADFWTKDRWKEAALAAEREDRATQDRLENKKTADGFVASHPEYVDNNVNGKLLLNQMNTMFGPGLHTPDQHEAAYEYLCNNTDFLKLDPKELEKQRKAADKQRYEVERARSVGLSEQELYSMPLDDLRRLDAIENQKRLQLAGERGGNGW